MSIYAIRPSSWLLACALLAIPGCTWSDDEADEMLDGDELDEDVSERAAPKGTMSPPVVTFLEATGASIDLRVCAGPTGMPAGLSLQWLTEDQFEATGWSAGDDLCKASLSGQANQSRFHLAAGECTVVSVGRLFDEEPGVSFDCEELECSEDYVFRAFAHANSVLKRSEWTADLGASTLECVVDGDDGCTYTQGYWKNHPDVWPLDSLRMGTVDYTDAEMLAIFQAPAKGNGLLVLAHQLMAARLNVANGANPAAISTALTDADGLIGSQVIPPGGTGWLSTSSASALSDTLADYNEGRTGPGHCDDK